LTVSTVVGYRRRVPGRLAAALCVGLLAASAAVPCSALARAGRAGGRAAAPNHLYVSHVSLTGKGEKPRGDRSGTGSVTVCVNTETSSISFGFDQLFISGAPTAGHIHRGAAGVNGPVVFPFEAPGAVDPNVGDVEWVGTAHASKATITGLIASPAKYYVNVHTKAYPNGAVRGQLGAWKRLSADDPAAAACSVF
jgi:hypothetical protein